jgi:hypothetical protein
MFNKRNCKRCGEKISNKYSFCPRCGTPIGKKKREEDFGMLGEDDSMEDLDIFSNSLFGKLGGGVMNKMLANAMKTLEKEMQTGAKAQNPNLNNFPRTKFRLMINGKEINLNNGNLVGIQKKEAPKEKKTKFNKLRIFQNSKKSNQRLL